MKSIKKTLKTTASNDGGRTRQASKLVRKGPSPMALEQRFMFDGAAVDTAVALTVAIPEAPVKEAPDLMHFVAAEAPQALLTSQQEVQRQVSEWLAQTEVREQLFALFNGGKDRPSAEWDAQLDAFLQAVESGDFNVEVQLQSGDTLQGAKAAFAAEGPDGSPVIYLNSDWLNDGVDTATLNRVFTEELGHAIDHYLNGQSDTAGDEGEAFSHLLATGQLRLTPVEGLADTGVITVEGQNLSVEFANFAFVNAYEMVYDLNNNDLIEGNLGETDAAPEQSSHNFNADDPLGQVSVNDGSGDRLFSGNNVSATSIVIGGETLYGWISRPIKSNGVVRGFYFWTDRDFGSLSAAQLSGDADGDRSAADNRGFVLVVDQAWFNQQIVLGTTRSINNTIDGNLGSINVANVGSSSDRVDAALNSLLAPNSVQAVADTLTVNEDSLATTGNLLSNDSDPNGDSFAVTSFSIAGQNGTFVLGQPTTITGVGTFTLSANGAYSFIPSPNYNGPVPAITYTVTDAWGATSSATLSISVTAVNDLPVALNDQQTVSEDSPATGNVLANDTDPDGDPLTITGFTLFGEAGPFAVGTAYVITGVGSFTLNADGSYVFVPVANYNGSVPAVTYTVSDGTATAIATLNLTITPVNDAPVAAPDNANGASSATAPNCVGGVDSPAVPQTGNVMSNDTDPDTAMIPGSTHQVTAVRSELGATLSGNTVTGRYGTLTINPDGSYSYAVDPNNAAVQALTSLQSLSETFTYTITEIGTSPTLLSASSTLRIVINGGNDEPVARDDADTVNELAASQTTAGIVNFGTASGTTTVGGVLINDFDAEGTSLSVTQITTSGSATANVLSGTAGGTSLSLTFAGVPASLDNTYFVYRLDSGLGDATPQQLYSAPNLGSPLLPSTVTGTGNNKVVTISSTTAYYAVAAGSGNSGANNEFQSVTLGLNSVLGFDSASGLTAANPQYEATISSTPTANGSATFDTVAVSNGLVAVGMNVTATGTNGTFSGTVAEVFLGGTNGTTITSFRIETADAVGAGSYTFTFSKTVAAGTSINGQYGTLVLGSNGSYTYYLTSNSLNANIPFTERFTYTATDGSCTDTAVLSINITGTQIALADVSSTANEDAVNSGTVLPSGGTLTEFSWGGSSAAAGGKIDLPGIGSLTMESAGNFTFTPVPNYAGPVPSATFIADGAAATLALSITPLNDAPAGSDKTISINDTQTYTITAADFGFSDPNDTPANAFASVRIASISVSGGTLTLNGTTVTAGTDVLVSDLPNLVFTPTANGLSDPQVVIGFQVRDNGSGTGSNVNLDQSANTLTITASRVNDAPVNTLPGTLSTNSYTPIDFSSLGISASDADANDGVRDINTIVLDVSNGTLTVTPSTGVTVSGNGSGLLTLTSTGTGPLAQAQLQAVLASLVYQPSLTFSGTDQLVMTTTDKLGLFDVDSRAISVAPDNRAVSVSGTIVNEASPYVMFQVDATAIGQRVSLELGQTSNPGGNAASGLDFLPNLEYFNGTNWVPYTGGLIEIPATVAGGGTNTDALLLVRAVVVQDTVFESTSTAFETLQLTARNVADTLSNGPGAIGVSQIRDDGQGTIFLAGNNSFTANDPAAPGYTGPQLDDDRPLTVTGNVVNEASDWSVFKVEGVVGQVITLRTFEGTGQGYADIDQTRSLQVWDASANKWVDYSTSVIIPTGGTLLVRVDIRQEQDNVDEQDESFRLVASNTGGPALVTSRPSLMMAMAPFIPMSRLLTPIHRQSMR